MPPRRRPISKTEQAIRNQGFQTRGRRAGQRLRTIGPKLRTTLPRKRRRRLKTSIRRRRISPRLRTSIRRRVRRGPLRVTSISAPRRRLRVRRKVF